MNTCHRITEPQYLKWLQNHLILLMKNWDREGQIILLVDPDSGGKNHENNHFLNFYCIPFCVGTLSTEAGIRALMGSTLDSCLLVLRTKLFPFAHNLLSPKGLIYIIYEEVPVSDKNVDYCCFPPRYTYQLFSWRLSYLSILKRKSPDPYVTSNEQLA